MSQKPSASTQAQATRPARQATPQASQSPDAPRESHGRTREYGTRAAALMAVGELYTLVIERSIGRRLAMSELNTLVPQLASFVTPPIVHQQAHGPWEGPKPGPEAKDGGAMVAASQD